MGKADEFGEPVEIDAGPRIVAITNPDKVMFPSVGPAKEPRTKLDLARYYVAVGDALMPTVRDRPVLLERYPNGVREKSFFQKRIPDSAPEWLHTTTVETINGTPSRALVIADLAHVLWAVNMGVLGLHVWPFRASTPEDADEMRIDLDPSPGVTFDMVREAAGHVRDLLAELGMIGFPKTTGSKGIHVYVRVEPGWDSFAVRGAVVALGRELARRHPDLITDKWWKEERGTRVFVDFNQNAPHKNMFGAWGVRPRVGAQVSTPFGWDELDTIDPEAMTIDTVPARLAERGDPWELMDDAPVFDRPARRAVRRRSRRRCPRCAVAAGVPEDAQRGAAGPAEPGPSADGVRHRLDRHLSGAADHDQPEQDRTHTEPPQRGDRLVEHDHGEQRRRQRFGQHERDRGRRRQPVQSVAEQQVRDAGRGDAEVQRHQDSLTGGDPSERFAYGEESAPRSRRP